MQLVAMLSTALFSNQNPYPLSLVYVMIIMPMGHQNICSDIIDLFNKGFLSTFYDVDSKEGRRKIRSLLPQKLAVLWGKSRQSQNTIQDEPCWNRRIESEDSKRGVMEM